MKNYTFLITLFLSTILSSTSHASSNVNDFCVADLKGPNSPSGYLCKPQNNITGNDFAFTFQDANSSNPFKIALSTATVNEFPGLNGQGISATRVIIEKGGVVPMHIHPGATELIFVQQGTLFVGFVTATKEYVKTVKQGELFVFPQGNLHFQVNIGDGRAVIVAAYNSENPRLDILPVVLFGNDLPSKTVAQTTFLDIHEVKKLKALFGGSG